MRTIVSESHRRPNSASGQTNKFNNQRKNPPKPTRPKPDMVDVVFNLRLRGVAMNNSGQLYLLASQQAAALAGQRGNGNGRRSRHGSNNSPVPPSLNTSLRSQSGSSLKRERKISQSESVANVLVMPDFDQIIEESLKKNASYSQFDDQPKSQG